VLTVTVWSTVCTESEVSAGFAADVNLEADTLHLVEAGRFQPDSVGADGQLGDHIESVDIGPQAAFRAGAFIDDGDRSLVDCAAAAVGDGASDSAAERLRRSDAGDRKQSAEYEYYFD
jgi:hypothetical protein